MATFSFEQVLAEIERQAPIFGIKPEFAKALAVAENTGKPDQQPPSYVKGTTTSPVGAQGVMQVMPETAEGLRKAGFLPENWKFDPTNLSSQVQAGLAAIAEKRTRMKNPDDVLELGAYYNGGNRGLKAYQSNNFAGMTKETRDYLQKVKAAANKFGVPTMDAQMTPTASTPASGMPTGVTTTTRRSISDPAALQDFLSAATGIIEPGGVIDQTIESITGLGDARAAAATGIKEGIVAASTAVGQEAAAKAAVDAAAATRRAGILAAANLNPDMVGNQMTKTVDSVYKTDDLLSAMKPEIDARMAVGFFDNPVEWLINQTRLPGMVAQYNAVVQTQNKDLDKLKSLQNIVSTQQGISANMDADLIAKAGKASAAATAAKAAADVKRIDYEQAGADIRDALTIAQLQGNRAQVASSIVSNTRETQTIREGEDAKNAAKRLEQETLDNVNRLIVAAGGTPYASFAAFKSSSQKERDTLLSAASSGKFGRDFAESFLFVKDKGNYENLAQKGGAAVRSWTQATSVKASEAVKLEAAKPANMGKKLDTEKMMLEALNTLQNKYQIDANTDLRTTDDSNPFKLAYTSLAKLPELANNPMAIFINTYGPQGKDPRFQKIDEQYVLSRFAASVKDGTMKMPDAVAAINEFYKVATAKQAQLTAWPMFGLEKPSKMYAVKLPEFGVPNTVDLGNAGQVENLLTYKIARDFRAQSSIMFGRGGSLQRAENDAALRQQQTKTVNSTTLVP